MVAVQQPQPQLVAQPQRTAASEGAAAAAAAAGGAATAAGSSRWQMMFVSKIREWYGKNAHNHIFSRKSIII